MTCRSLPPPPSRVDYLQDREMLNRGARCLASFSALSHVLGVLKQALNGVSHSRFNDNQLTPTDTKGPNRSQPYATMELVHL